MGMSANDKVGDEYSDLFCYWPALPGQLTTEQKVEEHQRQPDGWAGLGWARRHIKHLPKYTPMNGAASVL